MRILEHKGQVLSAVALGLLLVGSGVLAGLPVGPTGHKPTEPTSVRETAYVFDGKYTWRPPVATDGTGKVLRDHPALSDPAQFANVVEQMLDLGGAEPNIGVTSQGNIFVTTFDQVQRSSDGGKTWEVVWEFVTPNFPETVDRYSTWDPMLWVDPDTDRVFVSHLTGWVYPGGIVLPYCSNLEYSDDEGATWTTPNPLPDSTCDVPTLNDHQKIITARSGPNAVLAPGAAPLSLLPNAYESVFYQCTNKLFATTGTWCGVSFDSGATFSYTTKVKPAEVDDVLDDAGLGIGCPGINGHPASFPDGTVVVPLCGGSGSKSHQEPIVGVSEDNGLTWDVREFSGRIGQKEIDPDITVTPDGTAYYLFRGGDQLEYLLRSRDKFRTWEGPFRVSPPDHTLNAFAGITSGDDGRIAMAYLGTRDNQTDERNEALGDGHQRAPEPSYAVRGTEWHLFVTTSLDAASENPTFVTQQVTPLEDPIQVGCIWMYGGNGCRNLLDFIDMTHGPDGRFYVSLTDGCSPRNGCTGDPEAATYQSTDHNVAVAVQDSGPSLFAEKGVLPSLNLQPPAPLPR